MFPAYNQSFERVSEEAHGDVPTLLSESDLLSELGFDTIDGDSIFPIDFPIDGICDQTELNESVMPVTEPHELDKYLGPASSQIPSFQCDNNRALMNNCVVQFARKEKKLVSTTRPIELSSSVGVGQPHKTHKPSHKIELVHRLEESFRARYKSDYFAQSGKSRKPRYVADRIGNHFITLRVPVGVHGKIRVDWLTIPTKSGHRYTMPYRFQESNESSDVPDRNPTFLDIKADRNGVMKIYLVLIKSKQDALKTLQPLQPFHPMQDILGFSPKKETEQTVILNPKQLIQAYQLDHSQLAFTFCAVGSDGQSCIPEWDTTIYSTVLKELPPDNTKQKAVTCPQCTHVFPVSICGGNNEEDNVQETKSNKRKADQDMNGRSIKKENSF